MPERSAPAGAEALPGADGPGVPAKAKAYLCCSYAMAAWAWRSWEFVVALVLIELYPNSLLMVSAYGLLDNVARVVLGPVVGGFVDSSERLPGAVSMLRLQNECIGGSALAALVLLWPGSPAAHTAWSYWLLMWVVTVLGATSSSGSTGVSIAVERESVTALCGGDSEMLSRLNSVMRAIDLSCLLLAPLAAGVLMTAAGPFAAVAAMAGYCMLAYGPEVLLLKAAFRLSPALRAPKHVDQSHTGQGGQGPAAPTTTVDLEAGDGNPGSRSANGGSSVKSRGINQPIILAKGVSSGGRGNEDGEDHDDVVSNDPRRPLLSPQPSSASVSISIALSTAVSREASVAGSSPKSFGGRYSGSGARKASLRSALASDWDAEGEEQEGNEGRGGDGREGGGDGEDVGGTGGEGGMSGGRSLRSSSGGGGGEREEWRLGQPRRDGRSKGGEDPEGGEEQEEEEQQRRGDQERAPLLDGRSSDGDPGGSTRRPGAGTGAGAAGLGAVGGKDSVERGARSGGEAGGNSRSRFRGGCGRACCAAVARPFVEYGTSWRTYVRQSVVLPCVALALLYMTVLSLGFLMTSYLRWTGLTQAEVAGYRGIGALTGLAATAIFPPLRRRLGLHACAVLGIVYQLACLAGGVLPVTLMAGALAGGGGGGGGGAPGEGAEVVPARAPSVAAVRVLVAGVVASRTGLWMYDLAVTQLVQERVDQEHLGAVYGVQSSLQATCEMLSFVAGLAAPDPAAFGALMLASLVSVAAAVAMVVGYVLREWRRGG